MFGTATVQSWDGTTKFRAVLCNAYREGKGYAICDVDSEKYHLLEGQTILVSYTPENQWADIVTMDMVGDAFQAVEAAWQFMDAPRSCGLSDGDVVTLLANARRRL